MGHLQLARHEEDEATIVKHLALRHVLQLPFPATGTVNRPFLQIWCTGVTQSHTSV